MKKFIITSLLFLFLIQLGYSQWSGSTNPSDVTIGGAPTSRNLQIIGLPVALKMSTPYSAAGFTMALTMKETSLNSQEMPFNFYTTSAPSSPVKRMTISMNGNVGIGNANPDQKLTVNGKIKCEEVDVVVDVPADYVFENDYSLMPLTEVARYIRENKHLPNVPNAQTLKENGWPVGEMNNKLLEKVEELTLYLIELKKENDALKDRLNKLEGQR
jgi:hypothetical protein